MVSQKDEKKNKSTKDGANVSEEKGEQNNSVNQPIPLEDNF